MFRLSLLDDADGVVAIRALAPEPTYIGRAPTNDLVLSSRSVSARHLAVWIEGGDLWVEDFGSRNGTFRANGQRLRNVSRVKPGEVLRLGTEARIRLDGTGTEHAPGLVLVCALDDGASFPVRGSQFTIGAGAHAAVQIEGAEETVLVLNATGELWLATPTNERPLAFDEVFLVGDRRFVVRGSPGQVSATWDAEREQFPYVLRAALDGPTGPVARLEEPAAGREYSIDAENRAVFLFLLGQRLLRDRAESMPVVAEGWVTDDEVASGIWGRAAGGKNLNVLVARVRAELRDAGFNPWFIEKRRGHSRLQLARVELG